jgi:hypothetical protein
MTIVSRGAPALFALLVGGACTSETINLLTPSPGDAAVDGVVAPDAAAPADAALPPDAPSGCPEVIDQRLGDCMSPPVSQCDGYTTASASGPDAQVFTPGLSGAIPRLRLWMRAGSEVIVSILDLRDDPLALFDPLYSIDANTLATTTTVMTAQFAWQPVGFSRAPTVRAGHPYAIHVRTASGSADWGEYNDFDHPTLDPYPGGRAFSVSSTGDWGESVLSEDFMFEVHVIPSACP